MDKDQWIRAQRLSGGSWPALVGVYAVLIAAMVLSAMAIT